MQEVDAVGLAARQPRLDLANGLLDGGQGQGARAEEGQETGLGHVDHQVDGGDAAGHGAGDVGATQVVLFAEGGRTEMLDANSGNDAGQTFQGRRGTIGQDRATAIRHGVERTLDVAQGCEHAGGVIGMRRFSGGITLCILR